MLKHNNEFILYKNPDRSHTSCSVTRHAVNWNPWSWQGFPETEDMKEDKTRKYDRTKYRTVAHNSGFLYTQGEIPPLGLFGN